MNQIKSKSLLTLCGEILSAPDRLMSEGEDRAVFADIAGKVLVVTIAAALVFGAVVGSYRGGIQVFYAAAKTPALFLLPLVVGLPAVGAVYQVCGAPVAKRTLALAGLLGVARTALLAAAMAPIVWLVYSTAPGYHLAIVVLAGSLSVAGCAGLWTLGRLLSGSGGPGALLAGVAALMLLGVTTAQTGWVLRPFVARPTAEVALLRPVEGNVWTSLLRAPLAASDIYFHYEPVESPYRQAR